LGNHNIRKILIVILCLILAVSALSLFACSSDDNGNGQNATSSSGSENGNGKETPMRFLSIEGDVKEYRSFNTGDPVKNNKALPGDKDFEGVLLKDFLADSKPTRDEYSLDLISSGDGFMVRLVDIDDVYIIFSAITGWTIVAPDHPISANAKDIDRIIVYGGLPSLSDIDSELPKSDPGLILSFKNDETVFIPMGYLLMLANGRYHDIEGEVQSGSLGKEVEVFTIRDSFRLQDVTEYTVSETIEIVTADGKRYLTSSDMTEFVIYRQAISCIDYNTENNETYEDVVEVRMK